MSVAVGVLGAAAVPIGVVFSRWVSGVSLLDASIAIPIAVVLGTSAVILGRRSGKRVEWTLGRAGGASAARLGASLGAAAIFLALTASLALGFYGLFVLLGE